MAKTVGVATGEIGPIDLAPDVRIALGQYADETSMGKNQSDKWRRRRNMLVIFSTVLESLAQAGYSPEISKQKSYYNGTS